MSDALKEVRSVLRNQAFEELIENADKCASYCRSIGEAAYRGDELTVGVHIRQLRAVCVEMIRLFKDVVDGQDAATGRPKPAHDNGSDQRPGDGVA